MFGEGYKEEKLAYFLLIISCLPDIFQHTQTSGDRLLCVQSAGMHFSFHEFAQLPCELLSPVC